MHVIIKSNGIIIIVYSILLHHRAINVMLFGKLTTLLIPVDVCLGVLIILVYYTVLFYTCDRCQENHLCPQRNLAFHLHLKRNTAGRNVHKIEGLLN